MKRDWFKSRFSLISKSPLTKKSKMKKSNKKDKLNVWSKYCSNSSTDEYSLPKVYIEGVSIDREVI